MNPLTATIINAVLTAALAGFAGFQGAGGNGTAAIGAGIAAAVAALNTLFHSVSSSQSGPLGK